jgi:hypothetical protein
MAGSLEEPIPLITLLITALLIAAQAARPGYVVAAPEPGWISLFNDKNLDGWTVKCRPQDNDKRGFEIA